MGSRRPCPPAPGPLEDYAQQFDPLFSSLAQRRSFRDYLQGLLLPRDRHKTLTGLAAAEPVVGAQHREVQPGAGWSPERCLPGLLGRARLMDEIAGAVREGRTDAEHGMLLSARDRRPSR
jgi:hypothetical protein